MVRSDNTTLTREEVRSNVSLMGSNGNLVIHADNLAKLSEEQLHWAGLLTPNVEADGRALDLLQKEMPEVYVVRHDRPAGKWVTLALFNWSDAPADRSIDLAQLGFPHGTPLHGFDFWEEKYFPVTSATLEFKQVPTHGCKLLRFCVDDGTPCLVGDTLHLSQGAEIESWAAKGKMLTLSTMDLERQAQGGLWLWLPETPARITTDGGENLPFSLLSDHVIHMPLQFTGKLSLTCQFL